MSQLLPDHQAREAALDISSSFIVQAPAGSGKTELLTLRYLKLLAVCEQPEEVLAITFTRKAASEMRNRIIRVLNWCQDCEAGDATAENEIEKLRLEIGLTVLANDKHKTWHLLENPSRFRVQTIDSFCFYLANQLPILSQVGGNPNVTEHIEFCFREAINATLANLESESPLADDIETVLAHLDNDIAAVENQLVNLLYKRDQWANYILSITGSTDQTLDYLQQGLQELIQESLQELHALLQPDQQQLVGLLNFAATNLAQIEHSSVADFIPSSTLPSPNEKELSNWVLLTDILLKKDGDWLRAANKNHGFPPGDSSDKEHQALCKLNKAARIELIDKYQGNEELLEALNYIRLLPDPRLDSKQWQFLTALCRLLHSLSGELLLAFSKFRVVDYTQTGAAARLALGNPEEPTDLAMALDHVIRHILVDEFQDTSQLQLELLQQLTAGWEPDDGRSLFLVGDAMQSCYGFRNANVGIYLSVRENGLGDLPLEDLTLSSNFRSQQPVVDWVNTVFHNAFPQQANISRGAVPYSPAAVIHPKTDSSGIDVTLLNYDPDDRALAQQAEAELVKNRVCELRANFADDSIAVLVRTRGQLATIVPALRSAGLNWTASDIDKLASLPIIEDLISLVRVILNPGDRLAWLALLRAPWCGLSASDLLTIARADENCDIWQAIRTGADINLLSGHARAALPAFVDVMEFVVSVRFRRSLRQSVETAWGLLRGLNCCQSELELQSIDRFFRLLEEQETAGGLSNFFEFEEKVNEAFIPSPANDQSSGGLFLMTMHKAKGLEYDHVILPGLDRVPRSDDKSLLLWHQRINQQQQSKLYMAGVTETGSEDSPLYQLLRHEQRQKLQLESTRLLYIAVTRACKSASLFASLRRNPKGEVADPQAGSLLSRIWSQLEGVENLQQLPLEEVLTTIKLDKQAASKPLPGTTPIKRFNEPLQLKDWEIQRLRDETAQTETDAAAEHDSSHENSLENFELESLQGTLVHQCLEDYVSADDKTAYIENLEKLKPYWTLSLRHLDLEDNRMTLALDFITESILRTVNDPSLNWLFDNSLLHSRCELELTRNNGGFLTNYVIDRTFVDNNEVRWVIDYKTASPNRGQSLEAFIEQQKELHASQLNNYRQLFEEMEARPVKSALLLTSVPTLVEIA